MEKTFGVTVEKPSEKTVEETFGDSVEETLKKAMQQNGCPQLLFDLDEVGTWFQVTLPIHPEFELKQPLVSI